jgi:hypothetical protein
VGALRGGYGAFGPLALWFMALALASCAQDRGDLRPSRAWEPAASLDGRVRGTGIGWPALALMGWSAGHSGQFACEMCVRPLGKMLPLDEALLPKFL